MTLPASFLRDGFVGIEALAKKRPRLMVGTEGRSNTGKTEFALSAPGPGIALCLDRGFEAMLHNPNPPETRRDDFAFDVVPVMMATQSNKADVYLPYWQRFYIRFLKALDNLDARTILLDGDSDSWELERLAAHGKLHGVFPQTKFTDVKAERRVMIARAWDSGKIIIATNKIKDKWADVKDAKGNPVLDPSGEPKRAPTGEDERQGFPDQDYLWQIQLRHLYRPPGVSTVTKRPYARSWGIRILKCKADTTHEGTELWGDTCNFQSLVQLVYPSISLQEWGY